MQWNACESLILISASSLESTDSTFVPQVLQMCVVEIKCPHFPILAPSKKVKSEESKLHYIEALQMHWKLKFYTQPKPLSTSAPVVLLLYLILYQWGS